MADRYWVGGTGTWSSTNTANWSASSGGASGASVPTATDNVFFDANSNVGTGAFTVTMANSPRVCNDITISGLDGAMTLAGSAIGLTVSGSLSFPATNFTRTYTGTTTFNATTTGKTITTNGVAFGAAVTFSGVGGGWQLQDALTTASTAAITLTAGSLDLNGKTLTGGTFSSNNSNTRSIAFGSTGSVVVNTATAASTVLDMATATGFTFTGTSNISAAMSVTRTFNFGGTAGATTSNSLSISLTSGASVPTFTGLFRQIDFTGSTSNPGSVTISCHGFTLASGGTYALTSFSTFGDGTLTFVGKTIRNLTINGSGITTTLGDNGSVSGTTDVTLTAGTLALSSYTLTTPTFSSSNSNTRSINFGTTGQITLTGNAATVWTTATTTGFSSTGTFLVVSNYSGSTGTRTFSLGSLAVDFKAGSASGGISFGTAGTDIVSVIGTAIKDLDTSGFTGTFANATRTLTGNLTIGSGTTVSQGISTTTFGATSGTQLITTNGKSLDFPIDFNGVGGTFKLQDALTVGNGQNATLTAGSLDLNNFTLTASVFLSDSPGGTTRSVAFGSTGSIVLTSSGVVLSMARAVGFTFTGTSNVSSAMTAAKTFRFGSTSGATTSNRLNINLTSGSSVPTFTGSFRQINFTGSTCDPGIQTISCHGFTLASGGTYTSTNFTTVGDGTLTYTGKSISTLDVNTAGITTTLASAGQNATTTLTNGTLNLAGFTLTSTTTATTAAGTKNLTFNGGTLVCSAATTTAWNNAAPTNFTTTAGTGTGTISMTAATAKTFVGGGSTYNCTLNQGGAGTLTITGANTFNNITNTNATASQITFPASTTTTVNAFTLSGSSGNLVSLRSSTPGTRFTLSDASGTVSVSFLNIQDSNATGGATWKALSSNGNVDSGNNLGWEFANYVDAAASVTADATVTGLPTRIRLFAGDISASAAIASLASRIRLFAGDITGNASVEGQGIRIRIASGDVSGNAIVICGANKVASGAASVTGFAEVSAYGSATYSFNPVITATADVVANGQIIGEEWGDTTPTSSTWTTSSPAVSGWSNVAGTSSTWLRQ